VDETHIHTLPNLKPMTTPTDQLRWQPSSELIDSCHLTGFLRRHSLPNLPALQQRSTADVAWFWDTMLRELGIVFETPYSAVVDLSPGFPSPRWCVGGRMNITVSLLDRHLTSPHADRTALVAETEEGAVVVLSYRQLHERVCKAGHALRVIGIRPGDAVGVFMPMSLECVVAMLAIIRVGGVFVPLFSGYGPAAVASRLQACQAKAVFTTDGFPRKGSPVPTKATLDEALRDVPSVHTVIVQQRLNIPGAVSSPRDKYWHELIDTAPPTCPPHIADADSPCMLIYTSGTTGKPKGAVHTHCGFPVKAAQDMLHGLDLRPDETLYWITDIGWMMGPWLVFGTLLCDAAFVVYDGAVDFPTHTRVFDMVDRHRITALGLSPTYVRALTRHGPELVAGHDLSSLRKFGSTGEPWNPEPWGFLFRHIGKSRLPIWNYSGGTEISGGILAGNMLTPQSPCSFAGPLPGMAADVVDEHGNSVRGQIGELVIRAPWIGMTRSFLDDHERYLETYFSRHPHLWLHGDYARIDDDQHWYILGRSDDTIKIAGKRLGPAEVESILTTHPAVLESAAVGVPDELKGQCLVCFITLRPGHAVSPELSTALTSLITSALGKPLAPKRIHVVPELPKTRNGKLMRRLIRSAYLHQPLGDTSALDNPGSLTHLQNAIVT
jgi:acetyl-CoA synthetase